MAITLGVDADTRGAERSITSLSGVLETGLGTALGFLTADALPRLGEAVTAAVDRMGEVGPVTAGFDSLAASIGSTSDVMLGDMRTATLGLVSDFDLMKAANTAITLGVADSSDEFAQLAGDAITLGRAVGVDALGAMDALTAGIGRQSTEMLDNLGVRVQASNAYQAYADRIGVAVTELTAEQRQMAFTEAAMEAVKTKAEEVGVAHLNLADHVDRAAAAAYNIRDAFLAGVAGSTDLNTALAQVLGGAGDLASVMTDLARIAGSELGRELALLLAEVRALAETFRLLMKVMGLETDKKSLQGRFRTLTGLLFGLGRKGGTMTLVEGSTKLLDRAFGFLTGRVKESTDAHDDLVDAADDTERQLGYTEDAVRDLSGEFDDFESRAQGPVVRAIESITDHLAAQGLQLVETESGLRAVEVATLDVGTASDTASGKVVSFTDSLSQHVPWIEDTAEGYGAAEMALIAFGEHFDAVADQMDTVNNGVLSPAIDAWWDLSAGMDAAGDEAAELDDNLDGVEDSADKATRATRGLINNLLGQGGAGGGFPRANDLVREFTDALLAGGSAMNSFWEDTAKRVLNLLIIKLLDVLGILNAINFLWGILGGNPFGGGNPFYPNIPSQLAVAGGSASVAALPAYGTSDAIAQAAANLQREADRHTVHVKVVPDVADGLAMRDFAEKVGEHMSRQIQSSRRVG